MKWSEENIRYLRENFGKIKAKEIAVVLGRSYDAIHKKAQSLKLIGDKGINRKYTINDSYFSSINLQNSYWAGFIAADGCITKNYIKIMISIKDIKLLRQFKKDIEYTGPIYISKKLKRCSLEFRSSNIIKDLKTQWNIVEKKSLILKPPKVKLTKANFLAYVKGYIDGDGSIYLEKNKKYLRISIIGTFELLNWIKEKINIRCSNIQKYKNIYKFRYSGKMAEYLYRKLNKLKTFKLTRKWKFSLDNYNPHDKIDVGAVTV
jgi:hypothetical protein